MLLSEVGRGFPFHGLFIFFLWFASGVRTLSETRRKPIPGDLLPASVRATVSESVLTPDATWNMVKEVERLQLTVLGK